MNLNSDSFYSHFVAPSTRFYNCRSTGLLQMTRILLALIVTLCYVEAFDLSWQTANARRTKVHPNQVWSSSLIMVRYHICIYFVSICCPQLFSSLLSLEFIGLLVLHPIWFWCASVCFLIYPLIPSPYVQRGTKCDAISIFYWCGEWTSTLAHAHAHILFALQIIPLSPGRGNMCEIVFLVRGIYMFIWATDSPVALSVVSIAVLAVSVRWGNLNKFNAYCEINHE